MFSVVWALGNSIDIDAICSEGETVHICFEDAHILMARTFLGPTSVVVVVVVLIRRTSIVCVVYLFRDVLIRHERETKFKFIKDKEMEQIVKQFDSNYQTEREKEKTITSIEPGERERERQNKTKGKR